MTIRAALRAFGIGRPVAPFPPRQPAPKESQVTDP